MPARPEIFISAASRDLKSCRQLVRDALLTLGCVPVVQDHFPPAAGAVRDTLRAKIAACDAVIHLAGECYGFEPQERAPTDPRRSYTQLEYDIARELKKPLYTFLCAPDFPYDAHEPEPEGLRLLQEQHRAALAAGDHLYLPVKDSQELNLRVRELQSRVDQLSAHLQKTRSWLTRGVAVALVTLAVIGGVLWFQRRRAEQTEQKVAQTEQTVAQVSDELSKYRRAIKALADNYDKDIEPGRKLTEQEKFDQALTIVAAQQKISVSELKTWLQLFVIQTRANPGAGPYDLALANFAEQNYVAAATNAKTAAEEYRKQRESASRIEADAREQRLQATDKERLAWSLMGKSEDAAGSIRESIDPYKRALALYDESKEPIGWCEVAVSLENALSFMGRYAEAEPLAREVAERRSILLGQEHPDTLGSTNNLAMLLKEKGDYAGAEPLYRRVLTIREQTLGYENPDTLSSVNNLANLLYSKDDFVNAEPLYRRALEARERVLGPDDPDTLISINNLGRLLSAKGDSTEAEKLFRQALAAQERKLGKEHPQTLETLANLGNLLFENRNYTAAEPLIRQALEAQQRVLGDDHPDTLGSLSNLSNLLYSKGDLAQAESLQRRALETRERTFGRDHPDTLASVNNLGAILDAEHDLSGAEALFRRCLEARERTLGKEHRDTLDSVNNLADLLAEKGDYAGAEALYRRCLAARERKLGKENPATLSTLSNLAQVVDARGDYASAEPLYLRALNGMQRVLPPEHPFRLDLDYYFSLMRQKQGRLAEALPLAEHAATGAAKKMPASSADRLKYEKNLANLRAKMAAASPSE